MTNPKLERGIIEPKEFESTLDKALKISDRYKRLRTLAILVIFYLTGKRVNELSILRIPDVEIFEDRIVITFTLSKKRKTERLEDGTIISKGRKYVTSKKALSRSNPITQHLVEYVQLMKEQHSDCEYLFPSTVNVFDIGIHFRPDRHLSTRQFLRIIKSVNPETWCHLYRESVGAKIAEQDGMTIKAIYKIKMRLDLERESTAYRYVKRYAEEVIDV